MKIEDAFRVAESWRYKYGMSEASIAFIDDWAYKHTGLYPPSNKITQEPEFLEPAVKLSAIFQSLLMAGGEDPLGVFLSEFDKSGVKHNAFFPTASCVSDLMSQILMDGDTGRGANDLYEPCCGTGSITLKKLENIYHQNIDLDFPLGDVKLYAEDINPTALKAFLIQLLFKLQYLQEVGGKPSIMKDVKLVLGNTLTQKNMKLFYHLTDPRLELSEQAEETTEQVTA